MTEVDPVMEELGAGIQLAQQGDRAGAATLFAGLWERIDPDGDPLHRCAVGHWMADVQDDLQEELRWDLRALEAAQQLTGGQAEALYPSLHLNLGEVYRRLNEPELARHHLAAGLEAVGALPDDGYGAMIQRGLTGLGERLDEPGPTQDVENEHPAPTSE